MNRAPSLLFDPGLDPRPLRAGLVWAFDLPGAPRREGPSPYLAALLERVRGAGEAFLPSSRKAAVRNMLRHGAYKPAGRAKPSSEYLLAAALAEAFPIVNGPVDANNAASLEFGYPASIFDLEKIGPELLIKRGGSGDSYVFNPSGNVIELEDLLTVWRRAEGGGWMACGNPVKDSMSTKVFEDCRAVVAVVYAPAEERPRDLEACAETLAGLLGEDCGAAESGWSIAS